MLPAQKAVWPARWGMWFCPSVPLSSDLSWNSGTPNLKRTLSKSRGWWERAGGLLLWRRAEACLHRGQRPWFAIQTQPTGKSAASLRLRQETLSLPTQTIVWFHDSVSSLCMSCLTDAITVVHSPVLTRGWAEQWYHTSLRTMSSAPKFSVWAWWWDKLVLYDNTQWDRPIHSEAAFYRHLEANQPRLLQTDDYVAE